MLWARLAAGGLALTAVVATGVGWLQAPDPLTSGEAVRVARDAFAGAGLEGVKVSSVVEAGTYNGVEDASPVRVWKTTGETSEGSIELWMARDDGFPVFLDDRSDDGTDHMLSDEQFKALGRHRGNPAVDRQVRRNIWVTVAAALIAAIAAGLSTAMDDRSPTPARPEERP